VVLESASKGGKRLEYKQTNMKDRELTPWRSVLELKREVGNDILLAFRLGDFYEFSTTMR